MIRESTAPASASLLLPAYACAGNSLCGHLAGALTTVVTGERDPQMTEHRYKSFLRAPNLNQPSTTVTFGKNHADDGKVNVFIIRR